MSGPAATAPAGRRTLAPPLLLAVGGAALVACVAGGLLQPAQLLRSYLIGFLLWHGIALGSLAILLLWDLTGGAWGEAARPALEAAARTLPALALLFLPLVLGARHLYPWAAPEGVVRHARYLSVPFFALRAALYFAIWIGLARLRLRRAGPGRPATRRRALSGPGLVLYGVTMSLAAVDWIMSLEPDWFSTIFGMSVLCGQGLSALAFAILARVVLSSPGAAPAAGPLHDLGKLLLAFVMLWAYLAFSQLLIIWAGNLPKEIPWYVHRLRGGWQWVGLALVALHFALPFALLLSRDLKRHGGTLAGVAGLVLAMRLVDAFWLVAPTLHAGALHASWLDGAAPLGLGAVWSAVISGLHRLGSGPKEVGENG